MHAQLVIGVVAIVITPPPAGGVAHVMASMLFFVYLSICRQGPKCTKEEPCTPCELDRLDEFQAERCTTCSPENRGDCNFIPGEGPYCFDKPGSVKVRPWAFVFEQKKWLVLFTTLRTHLPSFLPSFLLPMSAGFRGACQAVPCKQCCTEAHDKYGNLVYDSLGRCL